MTRARQRNNPKPVGRRRPRPRSPAQAERRADDPSAPIHRLLAEVIADAAPLQPPVLRAVAPLAGPPSDAARGEVLVTVFDGHLVATRAEGRPCTRCAVLRLLARRPAPLHSEQSLPAQSRLRRGPLRRLVRRLRAELKRRSLGPGEALALGPKARVIREPVIAHADCEGCSPPLLGSARLSAFRRALASPSGRPALPEARAAYTAPTFGPLEILRENQRPGRYPLDAPLVWGSVFLSRASGSRLYASSTYGGIFALHRQARVCELMALSEGVERLATREARPDVRRRAGAGQGVVSVGRLFSNAGRREERAERYYSHGIELVSGRPCLVPFESVAVSLPPALYPQAVHREPFYSGTASHVTLAAALVSATIEVIKRDAFMISWYQRRTLPRLTWPVRSSRLVRDLRRYFDRHGVELELFDLSLEVPLPTVLLRLTATRGKGVFPRGGSVLVPRAGLTAEAALEHCLVLACAQWVSFALTPAPFKDPLDPEAVRRQARRMPAWPLTVRYLDSRNRAAHSFLGSGETRFEALRNHEVSGPRSQVAVLRKLLGLSGHAWCAVRLTSEHAARAGFEVAKAVIPGMVRLTPTRESVDFGLPRMKRRWPLSTIDVNPDPHPLY